MLAISVGQAKTLGLAIAVVLVLAALVWAWLMKTIVQKLVGAAVLVLIAALVWFQRDSLQDCADKVRENASLATRSVDTTCSFFGRYVNVGVSR